MNEYTVVMVFVSSILTLQLNKCIIMKKIITIIVIAIGLSSCGSGGYCIQSEWATPLSKQYSKR